MARSSGKDRQWAQAEFSAAELGDKRRTARLVQMAQQLSERPEMSLPEALGHTAALKAAYRFFDNADIAHESVLAPRISPRAMNRSDATIMHSTVQPHS